MKRDFLARRPKSWLIICGLVLAATLAVTPIIDQRAEGDYADLFQRALVTFALARALNGVISAVQGTELALQPAGVGVTLTPGEILDPINDLVERFSWIMLGATVSLGIQQVLLEVSAWWLIKVAVAVLALWLIAVQFVRTRKPSRDQRWLLRLFLVTLFLRFAVPLMLIANEAIYDQFLEQRYISATEVVQEAGEEIGTLGASDDIAGAEQPGGGIFESLGQAMDSTRKALDFGEKVEKVKARASQTIEHLIQLSVVFVLQTGLLPIAFLWVFLNFVRRLFTNRSGK